MVWSYISSFAISQRDMLDSIHRVSGTTDKDWTLEKEDAKKRWGDGMQELRQPEKYGRLGFGKLLYARVFYPDEPGLFQNRAKLANEVLGLPEEDLDDCTRKAIERVQQNGQMGYS